MYKYEAWQEHIIGLHHQTDVLTHQPTAQARISWGFLYIIYLGHLERIVKTQVILRIQLKHRFKRRDILRRSQKVTFIKRLGKFKRIATIYNLFSLGYGGSSLSTLVSLGAAIWRIMYTEINVQPKSRKVCSLNNTLSQLLAKITKRPKLDDNGGLAALPSSKKCCLITISKYVNGSQILKLLQIVEIILTFTYSDLH